MSGRRAGVLAAAGALGAVVAVLLAATLVPRVLGPPGCADTLGGVAGSCAARSAPSAALVAAALIGGALAVLVARLVLRRRVSR
jgi:hypothetical protein